ncbi:hypothetical protein AcV7_000912 [Taiwanofungus camphoratus]|nr:hypothetical protein AcV7_000912 [Antrodia cinnamomea]
MSGSSSRGRWYGPQGARSAATHMRHGGNMLAQLLRRHAKRSYAAQEVSDNAVPYSADRGEGHRDVDEDGTYGAAGAPTFSVSQSPATTRCRQSLQDMQKSNMDACIQSS